MKAIKPRDRFGKVVSVGDRVRVVTVTQKTLEGLPLDEQDRVRSMMAKFLRYMKLTIGDILGWKSGGMMGLDTKSLTV